MSTWKLIINIVFYLVMKIIGFRRFVRNFLKLRYRRCLISLIKLFTLCAKLYRVRNVNTFEIDWVLTEIINSRNFKNCFGMSYDYDSDGRKIVSFILCPFLYIPAKLINLTFTIIHEFFHHLLNVVTNGKTDRKYETYMEKVKFNSKNHPEEELCDLLAYSLLKKLISNELGREILLEVIVNCSKICTY